MAGVNRSQSAAAASAGDAEAKPLLRVAAPLRQELINQIRSSILRFEYEPGSRLIERALTSQDKSVRMAAISTLSTNPDDQSTETLLRLTRDSDSQVRAAALQTLGQIGSEKAQTAIIDATRNGKTEERIAAISGLASMDDARASQQLANLMRDSDPQVAQTAILSAHNGGPEVDQALTQIVNDTNARPEMRQAAAIPRILGDLAKKEFVARLEATGWRARAGTASICWCGSPATAG